MKPRFKDERLYEHVKYNCLELRSRYDNRVALCIKGQTTLYGCDKNGRNINEEIDK